MGKSLVAANQAISLAKRGYKVVAIDLDLGGANLHTCLGTPIPKMTLSDYFNGTTQNINELVIPTSVGNLSLISGAQDEMGMANLKKLHKNRLLQGLKNLNADVIILDLGAGTAFNTLDFFISSQLGVLVALPEPTSIENTYRFIRSIFFRRLQLFEESFELKSIIDRAQSAKLNQKLNSPKELLNEIKEIDYRKGMYIENEFSRLQLHLILNQVRSQKDIELGHAMEKISRRYFGLNINYLGHLDYDASVWQSVRQRKALLVEYPNAIIAPKIQTMTAKLLNEIH
ncbi:MAG: P-loop NTPase [Halobacteriovoraceae bacterium]|nr:P-loop NTPase [Halobacteriovoraceae bacterium]